MQTDPDPRPFIAKLKAAVNYDPDSGLFRSLKPGQRFSKALGWIDEKGYRRIKIDGKKFVAHRLAWIYVHGTWPPAIVDHINGDPDDNRIANLRAAEPWENSANVHRRMSAWGMRGAHQQANGRWQAQIGYKGKNYGLGTFDTKEEANAAYVAARMSLTGDFAQRPERTARPAPPPLERPFKVPFTADRLKELVSYDPATGMFDWKVVRPKRRNAKEMNRDGYVELFIGGRMQLAHRLAWLYMTGEMPIGWVDHINRVRHDNRWCNLRLATGQGNAANSKGWKRTGTGLKGAYKQPRGDTWYAAIRVNRKLIHLGNFPTEEAAHAAYVVAAKHYFGDFAHQGDVSSKLG